MSDMNGTARAVLRRAVMEKRAKLRDARAELQRAEIALDDARKTFQDCRDEIAALQTAAGDPIDIDPSFPEIQ